MPLQQLHPTASRYPLGPRFTGYVSDALAIFADAITALVGEVTDNYITDVSNPKLNLYGNDGVYVEASGGSARLEWTGLPEVAIGTLTVRIRSGSDGTFRWYTNNSSGTVSFTANGTFQDVEVPINTAEVTTLYLCYDGTNYWSGDICYVRETTDFITGMGLSDQLGNRWIRSVGQRINLTNPISWPPNSELSFYCISSVSIDSNRHIMGTDGETYIKFSSGDRVQIRCNATYGTWTGVAVPSKQYHVRIVRGANNARLYLNGVSQGTVSFTSHTEDITTIGAQDTGGSSGLGEPVWDVRLDGELVDLTGSYPGGPVLLSAVGMYQGNYLISEQLSGTQTGTPLFDRGPNKYHGQTNGVTYYSGVGAPASVRGLEAYGDYMWFDGSTSDNNANFIFSDGDEIEFTVCVKGWDSGGPGNQIGIWAPSIPSGSGLIIAETGSALYIRSDAQGAPDRIGLSPRYYLGDIATFKLVYNTGLLSVYLNGQLSGSLATTRNYPVNYLGYGHYRYLTGTLGDITYNGTPVTYGSSTFATVADKLRTPPQMGFIGWNARDLEYPTYVDYPNLSTFSPSRGTLAIGVGPISDGTVSRDKVDSYTTTESSNARYIRSTGVQVFTAGQAYKVSGWVYHEVPGGDVAVGMGGSQNIGNINDQDGAWTFFEFADTANGNSDLWIIFGASEGNTLYLSDIQIDKIVDEYRVPPSLVNLDEDALGDPFTPHKGYRPNGVNSFGEISYHTSMNVTTEATWLFKGNLWDDEGGVTKHVFSRWDSAGERRIFALHRSISYSTPDDDGKLRIALTADGTAGTYWASDILVPASDIPYAIRFTGASNELKVWKRENGVVSELTVTTVSGSVPSSLFATNIGVHIGADFNGNNPSDKGVAGFTMKPYAMDVEAIEEHLKLLEELT